MKKIIIIISVIILFFGCKKENKSDYIKENNIKNVATNSSKNDIFKEFDREKFELVQKGIILNLDGKYTEAIKQFDIAEKEYGEMIQIYLNRGSAYSSINELSKAESEYTNCIKLDSSYIPPLINRGLLYTHTNRLEKGIADFNRIIKLKPEEPVAYYNRAIAYQKMNKNELACIDVKKAISLGFNEKYDSEIAEEKLNTLGCEK
jgi:tetratricopeptide (TPR) repeat protein